MCAQTHQVSLASRSVSAEVQQQVLDACLLFLKMKKESRKALAVHVKFKVLAVGAALPQAGLAPCPVQQ
jgi:hypothetical protein